MNFVFVDRASAAVACAKLAVIAKRLSQNTGTPS